MLRAEWLRRCVAILLASCALIATLVPLAHAEPSTNERRKVAQDVAETTCKAVPAIPKLPPEVNPGTLCRSVVVENIDPDGNNAGVLAACITALPVTAKPAAKFCAQVMDKLLDPARQLFLDKVVPTVQQFACVTASPAAFDCLTQQVHVWLKQSIISLWQGLLTALTTETSAIGILDHWRTQGIVALYSDIGALAVSVLLGLTLTSLLISAIRFDFRQFGGTLLGIMVWGVFWSGGAAVAVLLLKSSDAAARWMAGTPDASGQTDLARAGKEFGNWVDYVSAVTDPVPGAVHPVYNPGSFTAILICLLLIIAIVVTVVALLMRNVALLLLIMLLPLTLAGTAGPKMTREWFHSALRLFVAFLLAKPLIVIAIRLGAVLVSVPEQGEPQATFSDALLGVTIILLAGLLPGVIYRFCGGLLHTPAGNPPRAGGGFSAQSAQSAQSSLDMTRMIMERNTPRPALAAGSYGTARSGTATTSAPTAARGLGTVGGPLALAAVAGAMAGGALESGGRWVAGQAATGGGVTGDVEAPHVPAPPISRAGYLGQRRTAAVDQGQPARTSVGAPTATVITINQTRPPDPSRPNLPPPAAPLIIPGTAVPEPGRELDAPRKALPGGESRE